MATAHVLMVIDRSGSMHTIVGDAQGGINNFFDEQKNLTDADGEPVDVTVSLAQFDDEFEWVFQDAPVADAHYQLVPRNMTALLDAIGRALSEDLGGNADRKVAVIVTDGLENASKEWRQQSVKELIQKRKDEGWQVHFLATDITTIDMGRKMGMHTTGYDRGSTQTLYGKFSQGTRAYMSGQTANLAMPDEVRDGDQ